MKCAIQISSPTFEYIFFPQLFSPATRCHHGSHQAAPQRGAFRPFGPCNFGKKSWQGSRCGMTAMWAYTPPVAGFLVQVVTPTFEMPGTRQILIMPKWCPQSLLWSCVGCYSIYLLIVSPSILESLELCVEINNRCWFRNNWCHVQLELGTFFR